MRVVLIYAPSQIFYQSFQERSVRFPRTLLPERALYKHAFRHFLPNSLLRSLARDRRIRLKEHALEIRAQHSAHTARSIPVADVWIFALLCDSPTDRFTEDFFDEVRRRAANEGVGLLNLASHTGTLAEALPLSAIEFPALAKLKANGLTSPERPDSYALLTSPADLADWQERIGAHRVAEYELQTYQEHRRNPEFAPYRCLERWICLCGDLTVGIRLSPDLIIKQFNSLTSFHRDPRLLEQEYPMLQRARWRTAEPDRAGPLHLSFHYSGDASYWDPRYSLMRSVQQDTGFEIGTLDVFEDSDGELHLIDYNEWTYESARKDLSRLWEGALLSAIHRSEHATAR